MLSSRIAHPQSSSDARIAFYNPLWFTYFHSHCRSILARHQSIRQNETSIYHQNFFNNSKRKSADLCWFTISKGKSVVVVARLPTNFPFALNRVHARHAVCLYMYIFSWWGSSRARCIWYMKYKLVERFGGAREKAWRTHLKLPSALSKREGALHQSTLSIGFKFGYIVNIYSFPANLSVCVCRLWKRSFYMCQGKNHRKSRGICDFRDRRSTQRRPACPVSIFESDCIYEYVRMDICTMMSPSAPAGWDAEGGLTFVG